MSLHSQGSEAKIYKFTFNPAINSPANSSIAVVAKHRFAKKWRHPELDARLTKQKTITELKMLVLLDGTVNVPKVLFFDHSQNTIYMRFIGANVTNMSDNGHPTNDTLTVSPLCKDLKSHLIDFSIKCADSTKTDSSRKMGDFDPKKQLELFEMVCMDIGRDVFKMHFVKGIIHGDLTPSNILLDLSKLQNGTRTDGIDSKAATEEEAITWIDFGLAFHSDLCEDRAVDLYLFERSFATLGFSNLWEIVLDSYCNQDLALTKATRTRFEKVRLRGRKR